MDIQESIIHGVKKNKDESGPASIDIKPRDQLLTHDEKLQKLGDDILKLYGKLANGYGVLGSDMNIHRFPSYLNSYMDESSSFINLTNLTTSVIAENMASQIFATTSYPIFFRYSNQGKDWILIALLKLKEGVGIDEETLELNDSLFFDISNLREAARIDLEKWQNGTQPYLSFIKRGSGSDAESSKYFREALSCTEYTDAKVNTVNAINALDQYCSENEWPPGARQEARATFLEYCKEKKASGQPVNLVALSALINDQEPASFIDYIREGEYEVNETFSPDPSSYRNLQRLSKRYGTISLGFEIDDLVNDRVYYDDEEDSIVLANPPIDLVEQIHKAKGEDPSEDE